MPNSRKRNIIVIGRHKRIARRIMASLGLYCIMRCSCNGSVYIYVRFQYCRFKTKKQIIVRLSEHERQSYNKPVDFDFVKKAEYPDDDFADECTQVIKDYIESIRSSHDYYKQ